MATNTSETKPKRLPKSQRKHVRRLKQAARREGAVYKSIKGPRN